AMLILPIAFSLWRYRSLTHSLSADRAAADFGFGMFVRWVVSATWVAWLIVLSLPWVSNALGFVMLDISPHHRTAATTILYIVPPAIVMAVCNVLTLSSYAWARSLDWPRGERIRHGVGGVASIFVPLLFVIAAIGIWTTSVRGAVLCLIGAGVTLW